MTVAAEDRAAGVFERGAGKNPRWPRDCGLTTALTSLRSALRIARRTGLAKRPNSSLRRSKSSVCP